MDDNNDNLTIPFNENETFEVRRTKALEEIKEVLKKYQIQMRAEIVANEISIVAKLMIRDLLPPKDPTDFEHAG